MSQSPYRTSRCILKSEELFLLVVHNNYYGTNSGNWGLPGGRIEWGEKPAAAARREVYEELEADLDELHDVGVWTYKGYDHKIYGSLFDGEIGRVDYAEILEVNWFTLSEVKQLAARSKLHAGFELAAIEQFLVCLEQITSS